MSLFSQINTIENSKEETTTEKHLPIISYEKMGNDKHKIKIDVGGGKHPNETEHWIQWIELRIDNMYIGRAGIFSKCNGPCCRVCGQLQ